MSIYLPLYLFFLNQTCLIRWFLLQGDDESSKDGSQPPSKKGKKGKKSISWADDESLTKICYFELDEEERGKEI